jgi:hypothetical protein
VKANTIGRFLAFTSPLSSYCRLQQSPRLLIPPHNSHVAIVPSYRCCRAPKHPVYKQRIPPSTLLFLQLSHIPYTYIYHHNPLPKWHSSSSSPSSLFWGGSLASTTSSLPLLPPPLRSLQLVRIPRHLHLPLRCRVENAGLSLGHDLVLRLLSGHSRAHSFRRLASSSSNNIGPLRASTTPSWTSGPPRPLAKWKEFGIRWLGGAGERSVVRDWLRG